MFIAISIFMILILLVLWYPGFMMARNMIKAVEHRNPTMGENILAIFPLLNMIIPRKVLYGSAKLAYLNIGISLGTTLLQTIVLAIMGTSNNSVALVFMFAVITIARISYLVTWGISAYMLIDTANCLQGSIWMKIFAVIMPPVSQFLIGSNCVALMAMIEADMEKEVQYGDSNAR